MKAYTTTAKSHKERYVHDGEKLFMRQVDSSFDGYITTVDEHYTVPMLIQKHTNPLNKNKHDMRAKYLKSTGDYMHIGNVISVVSDENNYKSYMAVTEPRSDGVLYEYKVLPLTDDIEFGDYYTHCVIADKGIYDEISYINEANVFEDKDLRAIIIQYNEYTSKLSLFDDVMLNDEIYRIVKIDNYTFKEHDEPFGVSQIVVIDTPLGSIKMINEEETEIKGVLISARVKDKILNSISRELYCNHNAVKRGDYITFKYNRNGNKDTNEDNVITEMYIAINKPSMEVGYDKTLMYLCENTVNLIDNEGEVVKLPLYFEDNRTRIDKENDGEYIRIKGSSYLITLQDNDVSQKLTHKVNRIIIKGKAYRVTGFEDLRGGLIDIGLEVDQILPDDNEELGIANYYTQMEEINNNKPIEPVVGEIFGSNTLTLGYEGEYILESDELCTWSTDNTYVSITSLGDNKCELFCNENKQMNKMFVLTATTPTTTYEKTIMIVGL